MYATMDHDRAYGLLVLASQTDWWHVLFGHVQTNGGGFEHKGGFLGSYLRLEVRLLETLLCYWALLMEVYILE